MRVTSRKAIGWLLGLMFFTVVLFIVVKETGEYYTKKILDERLQHSGLSELVHYKTITFSPFTLTPQIASVTLGSERYPWVAFKTVSLNWLPLSYPNLDVSFQFDSSKPLARSAQYLLSQIGVQALHGSGHIQSTKTGDQLTSKLTLMIQQVGTLHWMSKLDLLSDSISLKEFRSDLIASMALGQLSAMPILYGDSIAFEKVTIRFHDAGLIRHLFPQASTQNAIPSEHSIASEHPIASTLPNKAIQLRRIEYQIAALGLAKIGSTSATEIAYQLYNIWQHPTTVQLSMTPEKALSLNDLMLLAQDKALYNDANMTIR